MSFLLAREAWGSSSPPRSLAYLVGPLHEHDPPPPFGPEAHGFQARQVEAVRARASRWLDRAGINSGDVEAATITGLQAARAILEHHRPIVGEGDGWGRHEVDRRVVGVSWSRKSP